LRTSVGAADRAGAERGLNLRLARAYATLESRHRHFVACHGRICRSNDRIGPGNSNSQNMDRFLRPG
jgi:hypothetical protein